jgi:uncharacterized protein DUF3300
MRKTLVVAVVVSLLMAPLLQGVAAARGRDAAGAGLQENPYFEAYSPEQLDNLLAPVALYPDPLLAQVLLAATFPDEVDAAARYVRAYGQIGIDDQPWDVSVKAVAHYPSVLGMMSDKLDWTTAVGQAYVNQSSDVMTSVQRLRAMARAQGNLVTTPQQEVVYEDGLIYIWPAQPQYLYVPVYDPWRVYYQRWPGWGPYFLGFGTGFLIGAWLNHDCDWRYHRVYYTGWQGRGWVERSRPHVRMTNVYVNNRYENVHVNRSVVDRRVNYYNLDRYNSVHGNVKFDNRTKGGEFHKPDERVNNQILNRNIDTGNPKLDRFRGHEEKGKGGPPTERGVTPPTGRQVTPPPERQVTPPTDRQVTPRTEKQVTPPMGKPVTPAPTAKPVTPTPAPAVQPKPRGFTRTEGNFDPRAASQRGQSSRAAERNWSKPPSTAKPPSTPKQTTAPSRAPAQQPRPTGRQK